MEVTATQFLRDIQFDTYRGDGVAVRVTHRPTGISICVNDGSGELAARRKASEQVFELVRAAEPEDGFGPWAA